MIINSKASEHYLWCAWGILYSLCGISLDYSFLLICPLDSNFLLTFSHFCHETVYETLCIEGSAVKNRLTTNNEIICFLINSVDISYQLLQDLLISTLLSSLFSHLWYSPWGIYPWRMTFKSVIHQGCGGDILLWLEKIKVAWENSSVWCDSA